MGSQRFDIQALIPRGAKPSQVPEMLETMLKDRFGMVARHSQKVAPVYALTVGKGGMKLQPSAPGDTTPSGCARSSGGSRDCHRMSMEELATLLTGLSRMSASMAPGAMGWGIDFPATNLTELKGTFNFALTFGPGGPEEGGGSVVDAIDKLGLRLELQKLPSELIVVDKIEKSPTEN